MLCCHKIDKIVISTKKVLKMMQIRTVSDLRNKFTVIEKVILSSDSVYPTKNGYGSMVVLSLDAYSKMTEPPPVS